MTLAPATRKAADRVASAIRTRIEQSPRGGPMLLASIIGLLTGLAAVGFGALIEATEWFFLDLLYERWLRSPPWPLMLLAPALGGLLVAPITLRLARETRGQGVSEVMFAMETSGGRIRAIVAPAKAIATALTLGSGGSAGREGPITQIGAGLGSTVGQLLRLSDDNVRLLAASGVAGGVSAMFNAPIAGVFFALEVVLRDFNTRNFSVVVLASVIATFVEVTLLGDEPAIPIPPYHLQGATELPLYAGLGLISAIAAVLFVRLIYWSDDRFRDLAWLPTLLVPAAGGLIVGVIALLSDDVLGSGVDTMKRLLNDEIATGTMLLLVLLKPLATAATIGSGGSGGVFRPALFLGSMIGLAYGRGAQALLPGLTGATGAYSIVGMAALFAATSQAPISAVLMLFEMTRDHELMLPLMIAVAVSTVVSQLLSRGSIYTIGLDRRGVHIDEQAAPVNVMQSLRVADAMSPPGFTCGPDTPISEVMQYLAADPEAITLVLDGDEEIVGVISNVDLNEAIAAGDSERPATEVATRDVRTVFADQTLHDALNILASSGVSTLPVVTRERPRQATGLLRRSDVTQAYITAIEGRDVALRRDHLRPVTSDDVRYLELRVLPRSPLRGRELSQLHLTEDAVIVAVRHDGATLIPRGHTRLETGDRVTVIAAASAVDEVREMFEADGPAEPREH